jgi:hypothetical protein
MSVDIASGRKSRARKSGASTRESRLAEYVEYSKKSTTTKDALLLELQNLKNLFDDHKKYLKMTLGSDVSLKQYEELESAFDKMRKNSELVEQTMTKEIASITRMLNVYKLCHRIMESTTMGIEVTIEGKSDPQKYSKSLEAHKDAIHKLVNRLLESSDVKIIEDASDDTAYFVEKYNNITKIKLIDLTISSADGDVKLISHKFSGVKINGIDYNQMREDSKKTYNSLCACIMESFPGTSRQIDTHKKDREEIDKIRKIIENISFPRDNDQKYKENAERLKQLIDKMETIVKKITQQPLNATDIMDARMANTTPATRQEKKWFHDNRNILVNIWKHTTDTILKHKLATFFVFMFFAVVASWCLFSKRAPSKDVIVQVKNIIKELLIKDKYETVEKLENKTFKNFVCTEYYFLKKDCVEIMKHANEDSSEQLLKMGQVSLTALGAGALGVVFVLQNPWYAIGLLGTYGRQKLLGA